VKLIRSRIDKHKKKKKTLDALGLRKIGQVKLLKDTPQIRGMIKAVEELVEVEEENVDSE